MSENIRIVPISDKYYNQMVDIFNDAFLSKFKFASKYKDLQLSFTDDLGLLDKKAEDSVFAAVDGDTVLGLITLNFKGCSLEQFTLNISAREVFKKYGLLSVFKIMILGSILEHKTKDNEMYIDNVSVAKEARGRGVGTLLLRYAEDYAKQRGFDTLSLSVMDENSRAKALYERFGFKVKKHETRRILKRTTGYSGAYYMEKALF